MEKTSPCSCSFACEGQPIGSGDAVPAWELLLQLRSTNTNLAQTKLGFVGFLCLGYGLSLWPLYNYDDYKIANSSVSACWQLWGNDLIWTATTEDLEPYQKSLLNQPRTSRRLPDFGSDKNRLVRFSFSTAGHRLPHAWILQNESTRQLFMACWMLLFS